MRKSISLIFPIWVITVLYNCSSGVDIDKRRFYCESDKECASGYICVNNECIKKGAATDTGLRVCRIDEDCFSGERCVEGRCEVEFGDGGLDVKDFIEDAGVDIKDINECGISVIDDVECDMIFGVEDISDTTQDISEGDDAGCDILLDSPKYILLQPLTNGQIYIGWRLDKNYPNAGYEIYRKSKNGEYEKVNKSIIYDSTNYIDSGLEDGKEYTYRLKEIYVSGQCRGESFSEERNVLYQPRNDKIYKELILKKIIYPQGDCIDQDLGFVKFGDVDGDGEIDYLITVDCLAKDGSVIEPANIHIYKSDGTFLWNFNTGIRSPNAASYFQWTVWDLDGDGKAEVFGTQKIDKEFYLHIKDGASGVTKKQVKIPYPVGDDSVRGPYHAIAYLDGINPYIVVAWGTYFWEHGYIAVFDRNLNQIWKWEAPPYGNYGGAHSIRVADIDLDGKDEIIHGGTVFDENGVILWRQPWNHCDIVEIGDILKERPGIEIFYGFEQDPGGVRLVEAESGYVIWERHDYFHAHLGWTDDIKSEYSGMESFVWYVDESGWKEGFLYSANGDIIDRGDINYGTPVDWDGIPPKETLFSSTYAMDIIGDYREEQIYVENTKDDNIILKIYTNTELINKRQLSPWDSDPIYRLRHTWTGK